MSWRRNPKALAEMAKVPAGWRMLIAGIALTGAFVILGLVMSSGAAGKADRQTDNPRTRSR